MNTVAPRLLLVDDDVGLAGMLSEFLELHGFRVDVLHDGEAALARLADARRPDLVILDVMLPGISGFEVLQRIRESWTLPVIMLTARGDESDRIFGLMGGADDYLPKPFNPLELTVRIQAVLKRTTGEPPQTTATDTLIVGALKLDMKRREVHVDDQRVQLTAAEMRVLEQLMRSPGEVMSRNRLTQRALDRPIEAYDRSIDTLISKIRRKLSAAGVASPNIRGLRGHGYVLDDDTAGHE